MTLKAALSSQQNRLKKNSEKKAKEAAQKAQAQKLVQTTPGKAKHLGSLRSISDAQTDGNTPTKFYARRNSTIPFNPMDAILLIGEGNFSFAHSFLIPPHPHPRLKYLPPRNITATAFDSEDSCYKKYPESREIVRLLRQRGVEVLFEVDAIALERCKSLKGRRWDKVVWNFPHAGKLSFCL